MGWNLQADGSYAHDSFPVRLLNQGGQAVLKMTGDAVQRVLPLIDLWNNPLNPAPAGLVEAEIYEERKAQGINGGGYTSGTVTQRPLNYQAITGVPWASSLSSAQFTITASGVYLFFFESTGYGIGSFRSILRDVTNAIDYYGVSVISTAASQTGSISSGVAFVFLNANATFELAIYGSISRAVDGLGVFVNQPGIHETYGRITVIRLSQ